jgi:hypothetical protein
MSLEAIHNEANAYEKYYLEQKAHIAKWAERIENAEFLTGFAAMVTRQTGYGMPFSIARVAAKLSLEGWAKVAPHLYACKASNDEKVAKDELDAAKRWGRFF